MIEHKILKDDGDYYFGQKFKTADGMWECAIYYLYGGEIHTYIAVGEDNIDLLRDWAFEWLDIFGNGEEEDTDDADDSAQPDTTD